MTKRLLLISSSFHDRSGYLDHAEDELKNFLGSTRRLLFFPYAAHDHTTYGKATRARFAEMGYQLDSAHDVEKPCEALENAEAVFVGGGNTFRLLNELYRLDLLSSIRRRVEDGMPYIGSSAGSVVACPTLKTTNDMPIVQPPSFEALGLVGFQINPHYTDPDPTSLHRAETRERRLLEFLEENNEKVIALREGAILSIWDVSVTLRGVAGARIFCRNCTPLDVLPGTSLGMLSP